MLPVVREEVVEPPEDDDAVSKDLVIIDELQDEVVELIKKAVDYEKQYAFDACPRGLLGINAEHFAEYVEYIANRRLARLNLPKVFGDVQNPFPWLSKSTDLAKEKNFFETTVTEYQGGGLDWD